MKDVEFIKRCCEYADGFEHDEDGLIRYKGTWYTNRSIIALELLPQRAIEGVNRKNIFGMCIETDSITVSWPDQEIWEEDRIFMFEWYGSIDAAKRSALEYVFERNPNNLTFV